MKNNRGFVNIVVIIAILAILGGIGYVVLQKSTAPDISDADDVIEEDIEELKENLDKKIEEEISEEVVAEDKTAEIATILQSARAWCKKYLEGVGKCPSITFWSITDLSSKYAVARANNTDYLLFKKNNEWNVAIASEEDDICDTGSGSSILFDYCGGR